MTDIQISIILIIVACIIDTYRDLKDGLTKD